MYRLRDFLEMHTPVISTNSEEIRVCCPFCQEDDFKLYINPDSCKYHCFKCDKSGASKGIFYLLSKVLNSSFAVAKDAYFEFAPEEIPDWEEIDRRLTEGLVAEPDVVNRLPPISLPESLGQAVEFAEALKYAMARGLNHSDLSVLEAKYTEDPLVIYKKNGKYSCNLQGRILFPIRYDTEIVAWLARDVTNSSKIKYANTPDVNINNIVWPDLPPKKGLAILTEGLLDAYSVRKLTSLTSYSSFGKNLSRSQVNHLKNLGVEVLCIFWDIKDAKPQIDKLAKEISHKFKIVVPNTYNWDRRKDCADAMSDPVVAEEMKDVLLNKEYIEYGTMEYYKWLISA